MTSLTDKLGRPLKDLRISVMDTCNFRCGYCMPAEKFDSSYQFLKPHQRLYFEEICRVARKFAKLGVNKLRLTGGEPLLRKDLAHLVAMLKDIPGIEDIALTTNAVLLAAKLEDLIEAGLTRVTISLDALDDELFQQLNGHKGHIHPVLKAIELASASSLKQVKINCVLQKGINENQIIPLLTKYRSTKVIVRFIEFMDVGNINDWDKHKVVTAQEVIDKVQSVWPIKAIGENYKGEVASRYQFVDTKGEFGLISSISQPFCQDCSRIRLSADGKIYTCLFGSHGHDIKQLIRDEAEDGDLLLATIKQIWSNRDDQYSVLRKQMKQSKQNKIEMYVIGG
ncbi:MAG: GTP 3',8-cyclase MoaA [Proteobacteria bacterium]|nr:GTP 3',8-cyclase MoaA [Pseudomonadota bacterium]